MELLFISPPCLAVVDGSRIGGVAESLQADFGSLAITGLH